MRALGYVHTSRSSDGKISDQIARGSAQNSGAFCCRFTPRINRIKYEHDLPVETTPWFPNTRGKIPQCPD